MKEVTTFGSCQQVERIQFTILKLIILYKTDTFIILTRTL